MTTTNINKIVRSNINIKPWILSKNTSEIVNTYIQKLYKQTPNNFKTDLLQSKIVTPRLENKAPIRSLKIRERVRTPAVANVRAKTRPMNPNVDLLATVMNRKNGSVNLVANKKLLKSPNYKIYGSRRFGSSASSSSASIFRRLDDRRRLRPAPMQPLNYTLRPFITHGVNSSFGLTSAVAKYIVPARNQHMENYMRANPAVMEISSAIQQDLMSIDSALKDRISLAHNKLLRLTLDAKKHADPMDGWHHPPSPEFLLTRLDERDVANVELQEQHRRLKIATKQKHANYSRQLEAKRSLDSGGSASKRVNRQRLSDAYNSVAREPQTRISHIPLRQTGPANQTWRRQRRQKQAPAGAAPAKPSQVQIQSQLQAQAQAQAPAQLYPQAQKSPYTQTPRSYVKSQLRPQTARSSAPPTKAQLLATHASPWKSSSHFKSQPQAELQNQSHSQLSPPAHAYPHGQPQTHSPPESHEEQVEPEAEAAVDSADEAAPTESTKASSGSQTACATATSVMAAAAAAKSPLRYNSRFNRTSYSYLRRY